MIKTEAGEKMKEENPVDKIDSIDGQELLRQELEKEGKKFGMPETPEMNMGGLMGGGMGVIIGIEKESGNEIPAGSMPEEVADDIDAKLSEGEYVVPADVVRWHGVKTFEQMRCEAKMGMGLMAEDGRIAEVDGEAYEHGHESPEYEIEEKDKPEVEEAEVKVVEAAEGVDVSPTEPTGGPYYGYRVRFNPNTNRYEFMAVEPETQTPVTADTFDPALSTRYTPEALLGGMYAEETPDCPDGFYYDEEAGACMPEEITAPASVVQPDGGGDGPPVDQPPVPYNYQLSTKIAEQLGPLSAEDLKDYEGATLAEKALSRATEDRGIGPVQAGLAVLAGPAGVAGLAGRQIYNEVGAKRAAMTRQEQLGIEVGDLLGEGDRVTTRVSPTYNLSFDPNKAAFNATTSATISELQKSGSGSAWATDYVHVDSKGNEIDPFSDDADWSSFMDQIDAEFDSLSSVTGASPGNQPSVSVSVVTDTGESSTPQSTTGTGRERSDTNESYGGGSGDATQSDDASFGGVEGGWD